MDTRHKINPPEIPSGYRGLPLVIGFFDPCYGPHVTRLNELANGRAASLAVAIDDGVDPLVPLAARAEVVAGLASVRWVFTDPARAMEVVEPSAIFDERSADRDRTLALRKRVLERSQAK